MAKYTEQLGGLLSTTKKGLFGNNFSSNIKRKIRRKILTYAALSALLIGISTSTK